MSDIEKKNRVCQAREARSFKAGVDTEKLPAEVRLERIAAAVLAADGGHGADAKDTLLWSCDGVLG